MKRLLSFSYRGEIVHDSQDASKVLPGAVKVLLKEKMEERVEKWDIHFDFSMGVSAVFFRTKNLLEQLMS